MIRCLIAQILNQHSFVSEPLDHLYKQHLGSDRQPSHEDLLTILHDLFVTLGDTYILIDALDECIERTDLLNDLRQILAWKMGLRLLATGRDEIEFVEELKPLASREIQLGSALVDADIHIFISETLKTDPKFKKWESKIHSDVETALSKRTNGM